MVGGDHTTQVRLIVFGRQGAGKGTQCALLSQHYGIPHISTGDMLRAAVAAGTEFGLAAKQVMDAGGLVSDDIMKGIVADRLAEEDAAQGWLLDGFPRPPQQAEDLAAVANPGFDLAVNIEVPEDVVRERIVNRRVCLGCGTVYSLGQSSADSGECEKCGGRVVQRDDDTPESVNKRLALYNEQTAPLLAWFEERSALIDVDGVGDPLDISANIIASVEARIAEPS